MWLECGHLIRPSVAKVLLYCFGVSFSFVFSLYVFVPSRIRKLDRDDGRQIRWRFGAVTLVCSVSILIYPTLFCNDDDNNDRVGLFWQLMGLRLDWRVFCHALVLYTGPLVTDMLWVWFQAARLKRTWFHVWYQFYVHPWMCVLLDREVVNERSSMTKRRHARNFHERQQFLRNYVVGPLTEEIAFRACLVAPLLASGLSPTATAWTAPLWFGTAHIHHALTKQQQDGVVVSLLFQFAYTSLFGAYVAHAFIRTASLPAIVLCHTFCNYMGLPDLGFALPSNNRLSCLYPYRRFLWFCYFLGVIGFVWGFSNILPTPSRLILLLKS